jgi:hypothetical protein
MTNNSHQNQSHEKWQTIFTGLLVFIGIVYSIAAVFQWWTMKEEARQMGEQAKTTTQQLEVMKADIESNKANRSAEFIFKFDDRLYKPPSSAIRLAIESGKPILKAHGGRFSTDDLMRYLDIYETMHDVYVRGLINEDMIDSAYGHALGKAHENPEIQAYLSGIRKEDPAYYSGFEDLANRMKARGAN